MSGKVTSSVFRRDMRWGTALVIAALLTCALFAGSCGPSGSGPGFKAPSSEDFSGLSWTEAFKRMNEKLSREYAFTEWRDVDWNALYDEYSPLIAEAEDDNSLEDYYLALRRYLWSVKDGHMHIEGDNLGLEDKLYGAGFGLTFERLDDGKIIVNWVEDSGPASKAGMKAGAEVVQWNNKPIDKAVAETDTCFALYPPATNEMLGVMQRYFLGRASAGEKKAVSFVNPGESVAVEATVTAVKDDMESLQHTYSLVGFPPPENKDGVTSIVVSETLAEGYGYIKIEGEYDLPKNKKGDHTPTLELFQAAVDKFIGEDAPGLVIDVRSNDGGSDEMVAEMMSSLFTESSFYEYQNWYDTENERMEIMLVNEESGGFEDPGKGIEISPGSKRFNGPVVALVNPACISSGEGVAMCIDRLPNGEVAGFRGTNGSFGMVYGVMVKMPGDYSITYPIGQSLDKEKSIQVESREGKGGITPGIRVPLTAENAIRAGNGEDVELESAIETLREMQKR